MEQINELIKEIEESGFTKCNTSRIEANELSQQIGGRTIPRDADLAVATMYVTLLLARKVLEDRPAHLEHVRRLKVLIAERDAKLDEFHKLVDMGAEAANERLIELVGEDNGL